MPAEQTQDLRAALLKELEENPTAVITAVQKGKVLETLDADPKHRTALRTMVADKFPGTAEMMPETAVARAVAPVLAAVDERLKKFDQRDLAEQQRENRKQWLASLRAQGIAEKDLPEVEKLAVETANMDPQALALRWKAQQAPARSSAGFGRPLIPGAGADAYFKGIMDDPDGWLLNRSAMLWDAVANGRDPDAIDWTKEVIA